MIGRNRFTAENRSVFRREAYGEAGDQERRNPTKHD